MSLYSIIISNIKNILPIFICLFLTLISIMPIMPIGYEAITPLLGVLSMAFWIVHRPDLMSWPFVIIVGIISDILYGSTFGSAILASITIRWILTKIIHKLEPINIFHTLFYITVSLLVWLFFAIITNSLLNAIVNDSFSKTLLINIQKINKIQVEYCNRSLSVEKT